MCGIIQIGSFEILWESLKGIAEGRVVLFDSVFGGDDLNSSVNM